MLKIVKILGVALISIMTAAYASEPRTCPSIESFSELLISPPYAFDPVHQQISLMGIWQNHDKWLLVVYPIKANPNVDLN